MPLKRYLFFLIFFFSSHCFYSQTTVSGTVFNENQFTLSGVLVVNINTDEKTVTDDFGNFKIKANENDELRFVRVNYERASIKIKSENLNSVLKIEMQYLPKDIETVVLKYTPSGNLNEDVKHYGAPKKDIELNKDLGKYVRQYSSSEVLKAKPGEFIQPKGPGFEVTKIGYQWKILDVKINFEKILGKDYFTSLGLQDYEIFPFIGFTLKDFDSKNIRRFGRITSSDLAKFQAEAERKIGEYKNSVRPKK